MKKRIIKKEQSSGDDIFFSFKTLRDEEEEKKKLEEVEVEEEINIYHQNMPRKLERKPNKGLRIFLVGLLVLIISGGVFYFYGKSFFLGGNIFTGDKVELKIEGITEASAGEKITYTIKYRNLEKIDLSDVVLKAVYPSGFVYEKSRPLPTGQNNDSWDLGYVRSGKSGQIEIFGSLIGEEESNKKLRAELDYKMGGDKSIGSKEAEIETKISSSILSLDITGPSQLLGEEAEYIIKYRNNSNMAVEDIQILVFYPEDFVFTSSDPIDPQSSTDNTIWLINQLSGAQSKELIIKGRFESKEALAGDDTDLDEDESEVAESDYKAEDTQKIFKVQIGILNENDVFFPQAEEEFITFFADGDIAISLKLNDSEDNSIINLDDTLTYYVDYANKSNLSFQDVKFKLIINSNILDWMSLENESDGTVVDEEIINGMLARSIIWEVEDIQAAEIGGFVIKVKTKPYSKLDKTNSLDLKSEARVQTIIGQIDGEKVNRLIESEKLVAQVNTELNLQTQASLQNENEYEIIWQLTNSIHEVGFVKAEAVLPEGVDWTSESSVSAGDIYFDLESRQVSWQINKIPVGVDIPLVAKFKLKTSAESAGRRVKLLADLRLTATDNVTGSPIFETFSDIMGE
jgi:uncharacterized repeat protein (TIGR01451 family)